MRFAAVALLLGLNPLAAAEAPIRHAFFVVDPRTFRVAWEFAGRDHLRGIIGLQLLDEVRERS